MAQLRYRLRPTVVAGGNAHDQRGAECPLRLHGPVGEGIRLALSRSGLIEDDPDDAGIKCLPHWLVEGLLSRVARLGPTAVGKIWAITSISVNALSKIEDALVALAFDFSPCSLGALMQRLDSFVAPTDGPHGASFVVAAGADLFAHAALPPADNNNDTIVQKLLRSMALVDLVIGGPNPLRVYGDLAFLLRGRYSDLIRSAPQGHFKRAFARVLALAEQYSAIDGAPVDPDETRVVELPGKFVEFIEVTKVPWQLVDIVIGDVGAVTSDFMVRTAVYANKILPIIQRRWSKFIRHFPTLARVVDGADAHSGFQNMEVLASSFGIATTGVSSFMALETTAAKFAFVLSENTPAGQVSTLAVEQRVSAFVTAFQAASSRSSSAGPSTGGGMTSSVSSASSSSSSSSTALGAFSKAHNEGLYAWRNSPAFATIAANVQPALDSCDPSRVLRKMFQQRDLVIWQYLCHLKDASTDIPLFNDVAPYKIHLNEYTSGYIVIPKTSAISLVGAGGSAAAPGLASGISIARKNWRLDEAALKLFREGKFADIDYYETLVRSLALCDALGDASRCEFAPLAWPDDVCGDKSAVERIRDLGNELFVAFGWKDKDNCGFYGLFNEVLLVLDAAVPGTLPGKMVAENVVMPHLRLAAQRAVLALSQDASCNFPTFSLASDTLFTNVANLRRDAGLITNMALSGVIQLPALPSPAKRERDGSPRADTKPPPKPPKDPKDKKKPGKGGKDGKGKPGADGGKNGRRPGVTDTTVKIGIKKDKVTFSGNTMQVQIKSGTTLKWNIATYDKILEKLGEDKDCFCKSCNGLRIPHRLEFCSEPTDPKHRSHDSPAHVTVTPLDDLCDALDAALI